jgi:predicted nuclease of predicted toxin-antitoxin system
MTILIDECLPAAMKECLIAYGHECETVREAGFGSKKNGDLLDLADGKWDVLLTSDRNMKLQLNMAGRKISISSVSSE